VSSTSHKQVPKQPWVEGRVSGITAPPAPVLIGNSNPVIVEMAISAADIENDKFVNVNGYGDGKSHNREVDPHHSRKLARNIDGWRQSNLVLVQSPDDPGVCLVIDGQHRIYAIWKYLSGEPISLSVELWTWAQFSALGITLAEFIASRNRGRTFTTSDDITVNAEYSEWPSVFRAVAISPNGAAKSRGFNWPNVVKGYMGWQKMTRDGRSCKAGGDSRESVLAVWLDPSSIPEAKRFAEAMAWWKPIADAGVSMRVTTLYSAQMLALAAVVYWENRDLALSLGAHDVPERITSFKELPLFKDLVVGTNPNRVKDHLLAMLNYRRRIHLFVMFGDNGRTSLAK
jgi:hypothetical protein